MEPRYECRLTIIGRPEQVRSLEKRSRWRDRVGARHVELYENAPGRVTWWFETSSDPREQLRAMWSVTRVTLLLFYEETEQRRCGLVKAASGRVESCHFEY